MGTRIRQRYSTVKEAAIALELHSANQAEEMVEAKVEAESVEVMEVAAAEEKVVEMKLPVNEMEGSLAIHVHVQQVKPTKVVIRTTN